MFQKALAAGVVALLLVGAPGGLAAQDKEERGGAQASAFGWLSSLCMDLAAWIAGEDLPASLNGGCLIDPLGCEMAPPQPAEAGAADGGCWIDPWGCPGG